MLKNTVLLTFCFAAILSSCKGTTADAISAADTEETTQQIGETMSSIDETGGTSGSIASYMKRDANTFARYSPGSLGNPSAVASMMVPSADATACSAVNFGACGTPTANHRLRTFGGCTVNSSVVFNGTVDFAFNDAGGNSCALTAAPHSITRVPNYTVTGLRSASLSVSKSLSLGQTITLVGLGPPKVFRFDNDGIRRVFTVAGVTLLDTTSTITVDSGGQPMKVTGGPRSGRVLTQGLLTVTNNLNSKACSFAPSNVTWNGTCNCAVSGTWTGTCNDGTTSTVSLTGCGTAQATYGATTTSVTFDRCY